MLRTVEVMVSVVAPVDEIVVVETLLWFDAVLIVVTVLLHKTVKMVDLSFSRRNRVHPVHCTDSEAFQDPSVVR